MTAHHRTHHQPPQLDDLDPDPPTEPIEIPRPRPSTDSAPAAPANRPAPLHARRVRRPARGHRRWWIALGGILTVIAATATALLITSEQDGADGPNIDQVAPRAAAGERALTVAGFTCQDSLAEPVVRRCLRADGPVMVAVGMQLDQRGGVRRLQLDAYADEFTYLAGGRLEYDQAAKKRSGDRRALARDAYRTVVPALYGDDPSGPAGWAGKVGGNGPVDQHGLAGAFGDNGHTTRVLLMPASAPEIKPPTERPLKLAHAEFQKALEEQAGFYCDERLHECVMPRADTMPGEVAVAESLTPDTMFTARLGYSLTEAKAGDDVDPGTVARAFTRVLALAGYDDATLAEKVTNAVTTGTSLVLDTEETTVFVNTTITNDKTSYAALRVEGVRW